MTPINFNFRWAPSGIPINAATATIQVVDTTLQSTVVAPGTPMDNPSEGNYSYEYEATEGHTYVGTASITGTTGAQGTFQEVIAVPIPPVNPTLGSDDGSSSYIAGVYAQQRGMWSSVKLAALNAIATALANNNCVSYSVSGRLGSESMSFGEFLSNMRELAAKATEMEISLTEQMQLCQPFDIRQRLGIRGRWGKVAIVALRWLVAAVVLAGGIATILRG